jgi:DNA repair exonuclease SbcCD ATPase subunit
MTTGSSGKQGRRMDGMNKLTENDPSEKLGNVDQIRDIIFGPQLREYNRRFEKIESDLSAFQDEIRYHIDEAKGILTKELRNSVESLEKKLKSLSSTAQEEWSDLRQQLERTDKKFSNSLEALSTEVDNNTTSLREELSQTRSKLQEDIRVLKVQIHEELDRRLSGFGDVKVSRDEMAEILVELGMRLRGVESLPEPSLKLKGTEIVPTLKDLAKSETHDE